MPGLPPELMKLVQGGTPPGGAGMAAQGPTPAQAGAPGNQAPAGAPMQTPQSPAGAQASAKVNITMARDLLEHSLPAFGSETEEGKAILSAIGALGKKFGADMKRSGDLVPAEITQLLQSLPQAGGARPEAKAMMGAATAPAM